MRAALHDYIVHQKKDLGFANERGGNQMSAGKFVEMRRPTIHWLPWVDGVTDTVDIHQCRPTREEWGSAGYPREEEGSEGMSSPMVRRSPLNR